MDYTFKVDNDLKHEYLNTKPTRTAEAEFFVLRSADEYEYDEGKSIFNMSYLELKELIIMKYKNTSEKVVIKNVSILKTYIDFCVNKNVVLHGENRLATFTVQDAKEFVNKQAVFSKFFTKEQLIKYQNRLYNEQDKLILELPYIGARGRTTKEGTLEEIINLRMSDVNEKDKTLTLTQNNGKQRLLEVETSTIELIKQVYEQETYVENNGEETNNPRMSKPREMIINKVEDYVLRIPSQKKFSPFTPNLLNARMRKIQMFLDLPYLTITSLYQAGMVNMAFDIYKEKGHIEKDDYIDICRRFNYMNNGDENSYWFSVKGLFEQYKELLEIK